MVVVLFYCQVQFNFSMPKLSLLKKCPYSELFWSVFSRIQTEYGEIRSYSGPYFPAFGLNTERYSVSLHIQSECGKIRTRITPNTDTFYAVIALCLVSNYFPFYGSILER